MIEQSQRPMHYKLLIGSLPLRLYSSVSREGGLPQERGPGPHTEQLRSDTLQTATRILTTAGAAVVISKWVGLPHRRDAYYCRCGCIHLYVGEGWPGNEGLESAPSR